MNEQQLLEKDHCQHSNLWRKPIRGRRLAVGEIYILGMLAAGILSIALKFILVRTGRRASLFSLCTEIEVDVSRV